MLPMLKVLKILPKTEQSMLLVNITNQTKRQIHLEMQVTHYFQ